MNDKHVTSRDAAELRRRAEQRLQEEHLETSLEGMHADTLRLVHELQVHRVELELQNEELQRARETVEAGLEKYSDLYDFAPIGYMTFDREGRIFEANLTAASLLGIERSRLVDKNLGRWVASEAVPAFKDFLTKVFRSQHQESCELTLLRDNRYPVEVRIEVRIEAAMAASGRECRAMIMDIAERKRIEKDRIILSKLESTGVLAGGMAQDYGALLNTILLNLELAQTVTSPREEFLTRRLQAAESAALLAKELTRQLASFAPLGAPVRKATPLAEVVLDSIRSVLSGHPVRCDYSETEALWPAYVDVLQIGLALKNLILNAREAMPLGGVISVRAENVVLRSGEVPSLPQGEYIRVTIVDRGKGIVRDALPRIFDPYFSTKQPGNRRGLGLGLSICHTVVRKHGGAIALESTIGVGTTALIYLPACAGSGDPLRRSPQQSPHAQWIELGSPAPRQ